MQPSEPQAAERDMSERDKLHAGIAAIIAEPFKDHETCNEAADAVIRLVVEACCATVAPPNNCHCDRCQTKRERASLLRARFLPTTKDPKP